MSTFAEQGSEPCFDPPRDSEETDGMDGVMSMVDGLPNGWAMARLDAIAIVNPGKLVPTAEPDELFNFVPMPSVTEEFGGIDISTLRPFSEVQKGYTQFQSGDVISAKITPCMENGKIAVVPKLNNVCAYGSTEFHVLRPRSGISSQWIAYYLLQSGVRRDAKRNMTGSAGQLRVPKPWIEGLVMPIAPALEQDRIVAKIEELFSDLDAGVAALERAKANLKRYRAAVLKAAVEGKLTEQWRAENPPKEPAAKLLERILNERRQKWEEDQLAAYEANGRQPPKNWRDKYQEPTGPGTANLPALPEGWTLATIELISVDEPNAICAGPFGTIFKAKDFRPVGVPIIFLRHVAPGKYLTSKPGFMDADKWRELFQSYSVYGGELLVTKMGDPPGVCAIYPEGIGAAMVTPDVIKLSVNRRWVVPSYVMHYLNSDLARRLTFGAAYGVTRPRVTLPIFRSMLVPLPPITEQKEIASEVERRFSIVDEIESQIIANSRRAARLRQSILKRAFEGKLVPQDPTDEPASKLLGRIRTAAGESRTMTTDGKPAARRTRRSAAMTGEETER